MAEENKQKYLYTLRDLSNFLMRYWEEDKFLRAALWLEEQKEPEIERFKLGDKTVNGLDVFISEMAYDAIPPGVSFWQEAYTRAKNMCI